ncbi:MAG: CdaR family protein [Thermoanaerobaculia bacterium]
MKTRSPLFTNLGTRLLALAIAVAMWFAFSFERRERTSERSFRIPLSVANVPARTLIASPLPSAVDVRVRGPFTALRQLDPAKLEAVVDLSQASRGRKSYRLAPEDVIAPPEVEVVAVSPEEIPIALEAAAQKTVPIVPDIVGTPAEGARVADVTVEPRTAVVVGPESAVARLTQVRTESISVAGREAGFTAAASVLADAPGVRLRQAAVAAVTVRIAPAPTPEPTPVRPRGKRK